MRQVQALNHDTLDQVCIRHLGSTDALEQVLVLNPNLAKQGAILSAGAVINLPINTATQKTKKMILLWD
jgi:phage tail protein X